MDLLFYFTHKIPDTLVILVPQFYFTPLHKKLCFLSPFARPLSPTTRLCTPSRISNYSKVYVIQECFYTYNPGHSLWSSFNIKRKDSETPADEHVRP